MSATEARLAALGITLPGVAAPVANYVPYVISGKLVFCSGQICFSGDGKLNPNHIGKLGAEVSADDAKAAARLCGLNLLALAKAAAGDLDKVARCIRLGGFINTIPTYAGLPAIMNGASDLMVEVLGDRGRHARSTIGVAELPADAVVEVEAIFELM
jgi:enamine deaminase RidA (YjgF/YER057c/UK114 family)